MSVQEADRSQLSRTGMFGPLPIDALKANELLTREVLHKIKDVCEHSHGRFTPDSVADGLLSGEFLLWGVMDVPTKELEAVAVTRAHQGVFEVLVIGPNWEALGFLPKLEPLARRHKCNCMRLIGPSLWKGRLREIGWHKSAIVYEKPLSNGPSG